MSCVTTASHCPQRAALNTEVHGIVLAGVHAWGSSPLDAAVCRPLAPVATRPLITHALDWLAESGITTASICANGNTRPLCRYLSDGRHWGLKLDYYEDVMPRGPAGCVRDAAGDTAADLFVVIYGTILPRIQLSDVIDGHARSGAIMTMVATSLNRGDNGHAMQPAGIYVFSRRALEHIAPRGYQDIKEALIPLLYARGEPVRVHLAGSDDILRVADADSYLRADDWAVERFCRRAARHGRDRRHDQAWIHPSARIAPSAEIIGPVIIEAECEVGERALIIGPSSIGEHTRIGAGAVVARCTIWTGCTVGDRASLDRCIVADHGTILPGARLNNRLWLSSGRTRPSLGAMLKARFGRRDRKPPWTEELAAPADARLGGSPSRSEPAGIQEAVVAPHHGDTREQRLTAR